MVVYFSELKTLNHVLIIHEVDRYRGVYPMEQCDWLNVWSVWLAFKVVTSHVPECLLLCHVCDMVVSCAGSQSHPSR